MVRETAARQDPYSETPSASIAQKVDATSGRPSYLYIEGDDLLTYLERSASPRSSILESTALNTTHNYQLPHSSDDLDTSANMSRSSAQNSKKSSQQYQLMSSDSPADQAKAMSQNNKDQLINSLKSHKVNTITELRRIEKIFAYLDSQEVTEPMTSAWAHYVNSNNLLSELRGLTKNVPFSSECLDEAKGLVVADPASVRSWNYCWLVLVKIERESLILKYAKALASKRSTWGNKQPTADEARKFISAVVNEWTSALGQLLKHWDNAPSTTGA